MANEEDIHSRRRNANAIALNGLASYARFLSKLPDDLPHEERLDQMKAWFNGAGSIVLEKIDEYDAYAANPESDSEEDIGILFLVNVAHMTLAELMSNLPANTVAYLLANLVRDHVPDMAKMVQYFMDHPEETKYPITKRFGSDN